VESQALAAILFLYKDVLGRDPGWLDDVVRAKRPQRLPVVLTRQEVESLLSVGSQRVRIIERLVPLIHAGRAPP
jgi:hypothetical protein